MLCLEERLYVRKGMLFTAPLTLINSADVAKPVFFPPVSKSSLPNPKTLTSREVILVTWTASVKLPQSYLCLVVCV